MPESRRRTSRKPAYTPPPVRSKSKQVSPPWYGALIVAAFLVGIVWLVLYYTTSGGVPGQASLGAWNLLVGFGFILVGFGLATNWK